MKEIEFLRNLSMFITLFYILFCYYEYDLLELQTRILTLNTCTHKPKDSKQ